MRYKGKRTRPRLSVEQLTTIALAFSTFALGFALCNLFWAFARAAEPEPAPVMVVEDGRLPGDDVPATESAVWDEPLPAVVNLGEFTVTHYCACAVCCGVWADGITATGTVAAEGRTIAVDPEVIPYGTEVVLRYEDGTEAVYIAEDCGGAIQGNRIDIYMDSHQAALAEGVKTATVNIMED